MDKRVQKTKRLILQNFVALSKEKDFNEITITELSQKALIDRKTFYFHYDTIYSILFEIEEAICVQLKEFFLKPEDLSIDSILHKFQLIIEQDELVFELVKNQKIFNYLAPRIKEEIKEIVRNFLFEKTDIPKTQFEIMIEFLISGIIGVFSKWLNNPEISLDKLSSKISVILKSDWQKIIDKINSAEWLMADSQEKR